MNAGRHALRLLVWCVLATETLFGAAGGAPSGGAAPAPGAPVPHAPAGTGPEKPSLPAAADAAARMSAGAVPSWVKERAFDPAPNTAERTQGYPTEYLLLDFQARGFDAPEYFTHVVTRLLTADGADELGELSVDFDPASQSLVWHRLQVIRDGAAIDQLEVARIRLLQRETNLDAKMFDGYVSAIALLPDLRPGDLVEYAYSILGDNPIFGGRLALAYYPAMDKPVRDYSLRVLDRADRTLALRTHPARIAPLLRDAPDAMRPLGDFHVSETPAGREYAWSARDLEPLESENDAPEWFDPWPRLELSQYEDWATVAAWAVDLYAQPDALPPELETLVRGWEKQSSDRARRAELAVRFVQDEIRYLGIEAGENSHRPHPPAEVYAHRFGDCKDKTTLAVALLRRLGLKAWPALIASSGGPLVPESLPSPFVFDHVIVAYELGGSLRFVDPTQQRQGGRLVESAVPPYDWALLVRGGETKLTPIPRPNYDKPLREVRERFEWDGAKDRMNLAVETTYLGPEADDQRAILSRTPRARLAMTYLNFYARTYSGIELAAEPAWSDDRVRNRIVIRESYTISDFWETDHEAGKMRVALTPGEIAELVQKPRELRRRTPLHLDWPEHLRETIELVGFKLSDAAPAEVRTECPAFTFVGRRSTKGRVLTLDFTYRGTGDAVAPEDMRRYIAALDEVVEHIDELHGVEVPALPALERARP